MGQNGFMKITNFANFTLFLNKPMFPLFLQPPDRKALDPNGLYINKSQTVVVCSASTAYTSLYRGLKYLLEIPYFIQDYLEVVGFLNFETLCLGRSKTLPYG